MNGSCWRRLLALPVLFLGATGCAHNWDRARPIGITSGFRACDRCPSPIQGRVAPVPVNVGTPAPGFVPGPASPPIGLPPGGSARDTFSYQPEPRWQPANDPGTNLIVPGAGDMARNGVRLSPPEPVPPMGRDPAPPETAGPVDLPGFVRVKRDVASGQKPFADGLTWLKEKGYRTVLHVRPPGEDDAAARRQFEARGFRYLSLEVSPRTLDREVVEEFNRLIGDASLHPVFVYDRDGSLLGGLWYLHFRIVDGFDNERATAEAGRLGLNTDADGGAHRDMWLAVQRYLRMGRG